MHRQKTTFSNRVSRVATALEKRGVRATYELHDRVLSNRKSRRSFSQEQPELDDVQQRIVSDVDAQRIRSSPLLRPRRCRGVVSRREPR